jgi:hypothetical protein
LANAYQSVDRPSFFTNIDKKGKYSEIQDGNFAGLTPSNQNSLESRNSNMENSRRDINEALKREINDDMFEKEPVTAENNKKGDHMEKQIDTPEDD